MRVQAHPGGAAVSAAKHCPTCTCNAEPFPVANNDERCQEFRTVTSGVDFTVQHMRCRLLVDHDGACRGPYDTYVWSDCDC